MIGPTPLGLPSGAPRRMYCEYCVALAALASRKLEPRPPITIEFLRKIQNMSTPIETLRTGSNTMPSVAERDFSGFRFGLPPVTVANWLLQSDGFPVAGLGQRIGSRVPLGVTLEACGE